MHHYSQGIHTSQGHKGIPDQHFEEEQGRKGFFGQVSHLIRPAPSTRWTQIQGDLRPHLYDVPKLSAPKNSQMSSVASSQGPIGRWTRMVHNQDCALYWLEEKAQAGVVDVQAHRNADGDTLFFCHQGEGSILTEYGLLQYSPGSYICVPKCIAYTFLPTATSQFLVIESRTSSYREPDRGMVGRNAFYDIEAIGKPDLAQQQKMLQSLKLSHTEIHVKRKNKITVFSYESTVYDAVGWKGDLFPFTLHVKDLMPMLSARVHLPPSAHTTFVANGFVVCTFAPRPLETDSDALKVPFYHQNIDYDEILFYHAGDFFSRDNLKPGMMSLHPAGFPHGPHPKAIQNIGKKTHTDEIAVMVDSWIPFEVDGDLEATEVPDYWKSWSK